jgi:hypothetical protein
MAVKEINNSNYKFSIEKISDLFALIVILRRYYGGFRLTLDRKMTNSVPRGETSRSDSRRATRKFRTSAQCRQFGFAIASPPMGFSSPEGRGAALHGATHLHNHRGSPTGKK